MLIHEDYFKNIFNTVREAILVLDDQMRVLSANRSFFTIFKVDAANTIGSLLYDLGNGQWDIPHLRMLLEEILPNNDTVDNYEIEHVFESIGRKTMLLNACKIAEKNNALLIILLAIEDITEHKQLEDLLTDSEERYRRIFETASDGIVLLEKNEGRIIHANQAVEKMLGYAEDEYIGKNLKDIGVSLDTSDFSMLMQDLDMSGIINYVDVEVKTKSGQSIDADIYLVDRATLAQCNIRDVTKRKSVNEELRKSEERFRQIAESAEEWIWEVNSDGLYTYASQVVELILGYKPEEIVGKMHFFDLFPSDTREQMKKEAFDVFATKRAFTKYVNSNSHKNGGIIIMETSAAPILDGNGDLLGYRGVDVDITERKQMEKDLQTALVKAHDKQTMTEAIMASMGEGLSIQDTDFIIIYQNQVQKDLIGDHIGEHCYMAYEQLDHVCEGCPVAMAYRDGGIHMTERAVTTGKGTLHVEITASPLRDIQGNIVAGIELVRNVTDQKKLEDQLRHAQKMEAVGTLAGGIAHDFNNMLNVIMGYSSMVLDELEADDPLKIKIHQVLIAAERAANLTRQLLIFSRKQVIDVCPVNINESIVGIKNMLSRIIRENIDFTLNIAASPLVVMADAGQIEQVLMNLATNACDAMPEGGKLTIGTGLVEMDEDHVAAYGYGKPGTYAIIRVSDTGHGMDAETMTKIFDPFFTTKDIGKGTGLGLAISYGIIKNHDGYIKVYSEPGQGTLFKIYLPLSEKEASTVKKAAADFPVRGGNETILVAEDEASVREVSTIVLESFGYSVITAEDGEDAITKFMENRERISLVILDMIMPKKNGKEVGETVRNVSPRTKILFSSGYMLEMFKPTELNESGFDFIHKPVTPKDLLKKVREILDR